MIVLTAFLILCILVGLRCFRVAVRSEFGSEAVANDRERKSIFKIRSKYLVEEAQYIGPVQSDRFSSVDELGDFLCGSKIAFERSLIRPMMGYIAMFYHTGILLTRRDGGEPDVVELKMDPEGKAAPTLKVSPVSEVFLRSPTEMRVDNRYLKDLGMRRGDIDLRKTIYRFIRLEGLSIPYNIGRHNCDHLATYLLSGQPLWTTRQYGASLASWISMWNLFQGVVDKPLLLVLEEGMSSC